MDLSRAIPVVAFEEAYKIVGKRFGLVENLPVKRFKMEGSSGYVALQEIKHEKRLSMLSQYPDWLISM